MKMYDKTKEVMDGAKELMDEMFKEAMDVDMIEFMDDSQLHLIKKSLKLIDQSYDLALMQAKVIDEQNEKLDLLLASMEKLMEKGS